MAVRVGSELSGIAVGSVPSDVSEFESIYMLVALGIDSSTCDESVGISAEIRSVGEMSVV